MKVEFLGYTCNVVFGKYGNERTAIILEDAEEGDSVAYATANVPTRKVGEDEVIIKDYSENEGIYQALIDAGVIEATDDHVQLEYVDMPIGRLTKEALESMDSQQEMS